MKPRTNRLLTRIAAAAATALIASCSDQGSEPDEGQLRPIATFELPKELKEISGLAAIDERTVAAVQDEIGVVFFINVYSGQVVRRVPFGNDGDYEGVASVGDELWVLRSDGLLLELEAGGERMIERRRADLGLAHREFEGLCYDPVDKALLIAMKERSKGSKADRRKRRIYRFDPVQAQRIEGSALKTDVETMLADANAAGIELRNTPKVRFSAVAVQPETHLLYALSAIDGALFTYSREHRLLAVSTLEERGMPQPEGMTFLPNGDLVIATEGGSGQLARVQVFAAASLR